MKIALLSDTHVSQSLDQLPDDLLTHIEGVDAILHAGDIAAHHVLSTLSAIAPLTAVAGNSDPPEVACTLQDREILHLEGRTVGLKHGHQPHEFQSLYFDKSYDAPEMELFFQQMATQLPGAEIIVFGHFHRAVVRQWNDITFINPGAVSPARSASTFALLELGETVNVQILPLALSL